MNVVISDTAEYGNYLFSFAADPILRAKLVPSLIRGDLGEKVVSDEIDNVRLRDVNEAIRNHPIEKVGKVLRDYMKDMKKIAVAS